MALRVNYTAFCEPAHVNQSSQGSAVDVETTARTLGAVVVNCISTRSTAMLFISFALMGLSLSCSELMKLLFLFLTHRNFKKFMLKD